MTQYFKKQLPKLGGFIGLSSFVAVVVVVVVVVFNSEAQFSSRLFLH